MKSWKAAIAFSAVAAVAVIGSMAGCHSASKAPTASGAARVTFLAFTNLSEFKNDSEFRQIWLSEEIKPSISWDELVLSWNASTPIGCTLRFEVRALHPEGPTPFYQMGIWSEDEHERQSVDGQKDDFGEVRTDTLVLKRAAPALQLRVVRDTIDTNQWPNLRFLGVSLLLTGAETNIALSTMSARGRVLEVPRRSQLDYEDGKGWCSPTSVSMVLAWWSRSLAKPALDQDVPLVARGVYDTVYKGTGNWSFNAAFVGQFPELRASVMRLASVADLENWIARDVPVICSIDARKLRGADAVEEVGHLVVVVGFTADGDVVLNDPYVRKGQTGRKIIPRENFIRAWQHSHNTAYIIYPAV